MNIDKMNDVDYFPLLKKTVEFIEDFLSQNMKS